MYALLPCNIDVRGVWGAWRGATKGMRAGLYTIKASLYGEAFIVYGKSTYWADSSITLIF